MEPVDLTEDMKKIQDIPVGEELDRAVLEELGFKKIGDDQWQHPEMKESMEIVNFSATDDESPYDLGPCFWLMEIGGIALIPLPRQRWAAMPLILDDDQLGNLKLDDQNLPAFVGENARSIICRAFLLRALIRELLKDEPDDGTAKKESS